MLGLLFFSLLAAVAGPTAARALERDEVSLSGLRYRDIDDVLLNTNPESILPRHSSASPSSNPLTRRGSNPRPKGAPPPSGKQSKSPSPEPREPITRGVGSKSPTPQPPLPKQGQRASSVKSSRPPSPALRRSKRRPYSTNELNPQVPQWQNKRIRTGAKPTTKQDADLSRPQQPLRMLSSLEKFQAERAKSQQKRPRPEGATANELRTMLPPPPRRPSTGRGLSASPARGKTLAKSASGVSSPGKQAQSGAASTAAPTEASAVGLAKAGKNKKSGHYQFPAPRVPNVEELSPKEKLAAKEFSIAEKAPTATSAVDRAKAVENKKSEQYQWPLPAPAVPNAEELFPDAKSIQELLGEKRLKELQGVGKSKKDPK